MEKESKKAWPLFRWSISTAWLIGKRVFFIWGGVSVIGAAMPFIILRLTQSVIDRVLELSGSAAVDFRTISLLIVTLGLVYLAQGVYSAVRGAMYQVMLIHFAPRIQKYLMDNIKKLSLRTVEKQEFAIKYARIEFNINKITYFSISFINLIASCITVITMVVLAISVGWYFGLIAAVLVLVRFLVYRKIVARAAGFWGESARAFRTQEYYFSLISDLGIAKEIRLLSMLPFIRRRWKDGLGSYLDNMISNQTKNAKGELLVSIADSVCSAGIMLVAVFMLMDQSITVGTVAMITALAGNIIGYLAAAGRDFTSVVGNAMQLEAQKELVELCGNETERPPLLLEQNSADYRPKSACGEAIFELENVSFRYQEDKCAALKNVNLTLRKGEVVALVGENGSGKTTLVKVMLGLYHPFAGSVKFRGYRFDELSMADLNHEIGVVMQDYVVYRYGFRENIGFSLWPMMGDDDALWRAAELGDAREIIETRGRGSLDTKFTRWFNDNAVDLSQGQYQRVAVSRGYFGDRGVLVMDEPASALDPIAEYYQFKKIRDLSRERTAVLISHRIGFARLADRILVLKDGELIEDGSHDELMAKSGEYAQMFRAQAKWYSPDQFQNFEDQPEDDTPVHEHYME